MTVKEPRFDNQYINLMVAEVCEQICGQTEDRDVYYDDEKIMYDQADELPNKFTLFLKGRRVTITVEEEPARIYESFITEEDNFTPTVLNTFHETVKTLFRGDTPWSGRDTLEQYPDSKFKVSDEFRRIELRVYSEWHEPDVKFIAQLTSEETFEVTLERGSLETTEEFEMDLPEEEMQLQFTQMLQCAFGEW